MKQESQLYDSRVLASAYHARDLCVSRCFQLALAGCLGFSLEHGLSRVRPGMDKTGRERGLGWWQGSEGSDLPIVG